MKIKDIDSGVSIVRVFDINQVFIGYFDLDMLQKFLPELEVIIDYDCGNFDVLLNCSIDEENVSRETNEFINVFLPSYRKKIIFLNLQWCRRDVPRKLINMVLLNMLEIQEVDNDTFKKILNKMFIKEAMSVYDSI